MGGRGTVRTFSRTRRTSDSSEGGAGVNFLETKIGGAGGSNDGGTYRGSDGVERYVKFYKDETQAFGEALANSIYRDLGIEAPKSQVITVDGKTYFASDIVKGDQLKSGSIEARTAKNLLNGFAADVLTGNWDVIGLTNDNIKVSGSKVIRIDNGSAFLHRAQAGRKPEALLNKITEFDGFFDSKVNKEYARVGKGAGISKATDLGSKLNTQVNKISKLRDSYGSWDKYIKSKLPSWKGRDRNRIAEMLEARTTLLARKIKA